MRDNYVIEWLLEKTKNGPLEWNEHHLGSYTHSNGVLIRIRGSDIAPITVEFSCEGKSCAIVEPRRNHAKEQLGKLGTQINKILKREEKPLSREEQEANTLRENLNELLKAVGAQLVTHHTDEYREKTRIGILQRVTGWQQ